MAFLILHLLVVLEDLVLLHYREEPHTLLLVKAETCVIGIA